MFSQRLLFFRALIAALLVAPVLAAFPPAAPSSIIIFDPGPRQAPAINPDSYGIDISLLFVNYDPQYRNDPYLRELAREAISGAGRPDLEFLPSGPLLGTSILLSGELRPAPAQFRPYETGNPVQIVVGPSATLHSGELRLTGTDFVIPGRGFSYEFSRIYKSQIQYDGPLGNNWQHNYDQFLTQDGTNITVVANARADTYTSPDGITFTAPPGFYTRLVKNPDDTYTLYDDYYNQASYNVLGLLQFPAWFYYGNQASYNALDGSAAEGKLARLSDRNGNTMAFSYDPAGQLTQVTDTLGRLIIYTYAPAPDGVTRLATVTDYTGRQVQFTYDANGDLVAVTGPAVIGTPNGNDFPAGKTVQYTYSSGFDDERLKHNLLSLIAPNEVADGSLTPRLTNTYGTDPAAYNFDHVTQQVWGGTNASTVPAGGTITFTYEELNPGGDPSDLALPRNRTTVLDPNGNQKVFEHNINGHRLSLQEHSNRDIRPTDPLFWQTSYEYNADGQLTQATFHEGNSVQFQFDSANSDRPQQGNLLTELRMADLARGGDQTVITRTLTYEPIFNHIRTSIEPRGNDPSYVPQNGGAWSPERYTTAYTFDYEEGCDFAAIGAKVGRTATEVQDLLTAAGMCAAPLGDVNDDGLTDQVNGNLIRIQHPTVTLLDGSNQALIEGDTAQEIVELFTYNQFGQMLSTRDPEENIDTYEYYSEQDPNGDGVIDNPSGDPLIGGYLKQATHDTASAPGRDSGTDPTPTNIRSHYSYDAGGNLIRAVDGRGIATDYAVNQLNQVVQITRAAAHDLFPPDPTEPLALTDFQYLERFFYDFNDNLVLRQMEDRGNTSSVDGSPPVNDLPAFIPDPDPVGGPAFVDTVYKYDILDNRIEILQEVVNGATPEFLRTRTRYDPNGNQLLLIRPVGNATSAVYDERDLLFQDTRGATAPPALALLAPTDPTDYNVRGGLSATMSYHYDGNRNLIERVDAADTDGSTANNSDIAGAGDRTRYLYDGFDRLTSRVDSVGNQTVYQYDPASNRVRTTRFGPVGGPSPTSDGPDILPKPVSSGGVIQLVNLVNPNLLAASEYLYDELSRRFQTDHGLLVNTIPTRRPADVNDGATDLGKGDLTPGDTCTVPGAQSPPSDFLGCVSMRSEYDRNSRRTFVVEDDADTYRTFYDGADRVIKTEDPGGNLVETAYDDNHNVIETQETDVSQVIGVADELFVTTYFYDSLNRLQLRVDNLGHSMDYRYDSRGNRVAMADSLGPLTGATITRRAFPGGPLTVNDINDFGNVTRYSYDGLSRRTQTEIILTASGQGDGVNIGATLEGVKTATPPPDPAQGGGDGLILLVTDWDANSLPVSQTDDNGNQTQYTYDNLDRRVTETKGICAPPALADRCDPPTIIVSLYDQDDNLARLFDENGSRTSCRFDALNRDTSCRVTRAAGVVGTTQATYQYDGLSRLTRATDNNDPAVNSDNSTLTLAYDSLSRVIEETQRIGTTRTRAISGAWRAEGLRSSLIYPNNRAVTYAYDLLDRPATIADAGLPTIAEYDYFGPRSFITRIGPVLYDPFEGVMRFIERSVEKYGVERVRVVIYEPIEREWGFIQHSVTCGVERLLVRTYSNGVRETYLDDAGTTDMGYDGLCRPVQPRHLRADNSLVVGFAQGYDRMSNTLSQDKLHDPENDEVYVHDSAYRLTDFNRPDPGAIPPLHSDWALDGVGNWRQVDAETRLHTSFNEIFERDPGTPISILSDNNGNVTDDGTYLFAYDYLNRLRTVTRKSDNALIAVYSYDALGRRIRKVVTNSGPLDGTTDFYLDGRREIEERDGTGALLSQIVHKLTTRSNVFAVWVTVGFFEVVDGTRPVVLDRNLDGDNRANGPGDQRLFYHTDTLGSTYALTDRTGTLMEGYQYDAYGRQTVFAPGANGVVDFGGDDVITEGGLSGVDNPYLFTGQRLDGETGLYYYGARYLNVEQGRFLQRDPPGVWARTVNLGNGYAYDGNNPVSAISIEEFPVERPWLPKSIEDLLEEIRKEFNIDPTDPESADTRWWLGLT